MKGSAETVDLLKPLISLKKANIFPAFSPGYLECHFLEDL